MTKVVLLRPGATDEVVAELQEGDAERVRAGMEVARWTVPEDLWEQWVGEERLAARTWISRVARRPGIAGFATALLTLPLVTVGIASFGLSTTAAIIFAVAAPAAASLGFLARDELKRRRKERAVSQLRRYVAPEIILTSTGLLYGAVARLWSRDLESVWVVDPKGKGDPGFLRLQLADEWIYLPVPNERWKEIRDLAEWISTWDSPAKNTQKILRASQ